MQILDLYKIQECYQAVKRRDSSFIGFFFFGVKTTGVFCIPSCRARTPKPENMVYFTQAGELLEEGYRPCKLCKPTINAYEMPEDVEKALRKIHESPFVRVKDADLLDMGIRPEKLRRWFKKNYGITFQSYQRMHRINNAFKNLKEGKKVTDTAYDSGYESLSGFAYTFKTLLGKEPNKSKDITAVYVKRTTTPLGPMFICASDKGICMLEFVDNKKLDKQLASLQEKLNVVVLTGENLHIEQAISELREYFSGKRREFNVPLDILGDELQKKYRKNLQRIKYGETIYNNQLANELGVTEEEVGELNSRNSVVILIPSHRVIAVNNDLGKYEGGSKRRHWLLRHEKNKDNSVKN